MISVEPIIKTSYTRKGNEYKESNAGKYGAAAAVGGGATIVAMKNIPFKKVKEIPFGKIKNIKNVKVKMPSVKTVLQNMFAGIEKMAVKAQIKLATAKVKPIGKTFKKPAGFKAVKEGFKHYAGKIKNGLNILSNRAISFANNNTAKLTKAAKYSGFVAGAVVAGVAVDYFFNKFSAHRADKK